MNGRIPDDTTNHGDRFLLGLVAGSAIGTGLALYFLVPRLARELRVQTAAAGVVGVVDRVVDAVDDATRKGQAIRDDVADAVARGAYQVGRGAREIARGARQVEHFATASKTDDKSRRS